MSKRFEEGERDEREKKKRKHKRRRHNSSSDEEDGKRAGEQERRKQQRHYSSDEEQHRKRKARKQRKNKTSSSPPLAAAALAPPLGDPPEIEALKKRRFKTPKSVVKKLLKLHPDGEVQLVQLFQLLDEQTAVNISDLEDQSVKYLLKLLFDTHWKESLTFTPNGYVKRNDQYQQPLTTLFEQLVAQVKKKKEEFAAPQSYGVIGPTMPPAQPVDLVNLTPQERAKHFVQDYNAKYRPKSLLEQHRELTRTGGSSSSGGTKIGSGDAYEGHTSSSKNKELDEKTRQQLASIGYLSFDREKDLLAPSVMSRAKVEEFVKKSADLGDRFGSSKFQTSFI